MGPLRETKKRGQLETLAGDSTRAEHAEKAYIYSIIIR